MARHDARKATAMAVTVDRAPVADLKSPLAVATLGEARHAAPTAEATIAARAAVAPKGHHEVAMRDVRMAEATMLVPKDDLRDRLAAPDSAVVTMVVDRRPVVAVQVVGRAPAVVAPAVRLVVPALVADSVAPAVIEGPARLELADVVESAEAEAVTEVLDQAAVRAKAEAETVAEMAARNDRART